jgi:aryl-alcohol dehydrogenase-like predicted oxidoreductase
MVGQFASDKADGVLEAMDPIAAAHDVPLGTVALAWLLSKPTVPSVIASARNLDQLKQLLPVAELRLSDDEVASLDAVSAD